MYSYTVPIFHWCELWCGVYKIFSYESRAPLRFSIIMCVYGNSTMKVNYFVFIPELDLYWLAHGSVQSDVIVIIITCVYTISIYIRHPTTHIFIEWSSLKCYLFVLLLLSFCCVYYNSIFRVIWFRHIENDSMNFEFRMDFKWFIDCFVCNNNFILYEIFNLLNYNSNIATDTLTKLWYKLIVSHRINLNFGFQELPWKSYKR